MRVSYKESISHLSSEIIKRKYLLDKFMKKINARGVAPDEIVYSFQALMDGLNPLKDKADDLTLPFDHG